MFDNPSHMTKVIFRTELSKLLWKLVIFYEKTKI